MIKSVGHLSLDGYDDTKTYLTFVKHRGFPAWLRFEPGIEFRTDNEPFKVPTDSCTLLLLYKAIFVVLAVFTALSINDQIGILFTVPATEYIMP